MKTLLLISLFVIASCSNDKESNCDKLLFDSYAKYRTALQNCGGSQAAINEVNAQYNKEQNEIMKNCK
jgi:thioredoxin-related protein